MKVSIKYENQLKREGYLSMLDVGVISTEICRLIKMLEVLGINTQSENLQKMMEKVKDLGLVEVMDN